MSANVACTDLCAIVLVSGHNETEIIVAILLVHKSKLAHCTVVINESYCLQHNYENVSEEHCSHIPKWVKIRHPSFARERVPAYRSTGNYMYRSVLHVPSVPENVALHNASPNILLCLCGLATNQGLYIVAH